MNFDLSDEQQMLQDSIGRLLRKEYGFEQRRRYLAEADGWSRAIWAQLAAQGFLALPFDARHGGLGQGPVETMLVMEALGRALALEPYLGGVVIAGGILRAGASAAQCEALVPRIAAGELVMVLAQAERQSRHALDDVLTHARRDGADYVLDGCKILVAHGNAADQFIVSARTAGARTDAGGISLFRVAAEAPGLRRRSYRTQDGLMAADLILSGVRVAAADMIGEAGQGPRLLERAADLAIAALAAEAVGAMQAALDLSVDHLKQRRQFGVAIASFQALQHHAAEMLVELEQARSMAIYAALMVDEADPAQRRRALAMVKVQIGRSGRRVGQLAVQLHGGVGVSEEHPVGHYLKRLAAIETAFGDSHFHLARLAAQRGGDNNVTMT
jgi:pimeloyl-CoA dehydrogenase small subunit